MSALEGDEYELPGAKGLELIVTDDKVVRWRKQQLVLMGFTMRQAEAASVRAEADLYQLKAMLDKGCPTGTALRIAGVDVPAETSIEDEVAELEPQHRAEFEPCSYCIAGLVQAGKECDACNGTGRAT